MELRQCSDCFHEAFDLPRFRKVLHKGEMESKHRGHVMALRCRGNWDVFMLTTFHNSQMKTTRARHHKSNAPTITSLCLVEYHNNTSPATEHTDIRLNSLETVHQSVKWYKRLSMILCLINAHVLYQLHTSTYMNMTDFQLEGTKQLLQDHTPNLSLKFENHQKGII